MRVQFPPRQLLARPTRLGGHNKSLKNRTPEPLSRTPLFARTPGALRLLRDPDSQPRLTAFLALTFRHHSSCGGTPWSCRSAHRSHLCSDFVAPPRRPSSVLPVPHRCQQPRRVPRGLQHFSAHSLQRHQVPPSCRSNRPGSAQSALCPSPCEGGRSCGSVESARASTHNWLG